MTTPFPFARLLAALLLGALAAPAQAQVGQTAAGLLSSPLLQGAKKSAGGLLQLPDGSAVQLNERGGYLLSASVLVPLGGAAVNVTNGTASVSATTGGNGNSAAYARAASLAGLLSGYGDGLAQPLTTFLNGPDAAATLTRGVNIDAAPFMLGAQTQGKLLKVTVAPAQIRASAFVPAVHVLPARQTTKAPVTLRIYSDFQCPYCQQFEGQTYPALLKQLPADVQVEFHQLPLEPIHPLARPAAEASECAAAQGKFWPFKDALFADRSWLSGNPNVAFIALAGKQGLNVDTFKSCLAERGGKAAVDTALSEAAALGLNSTPTVFVNGFRAQNAYDVPSLLKLIDFARVSAAAPLSMQTPAMFPAPAAPKP